MGPISARPPPSTPGATGIPIRKPPALTASRPPAPTASRGRPTTSSCPVRPPGRCLDETPPAQPPDAAIADNLRGNRNGGLAHSAAGPRPRLEGGSQPRPVGGPPQAPGLWLRRTRGQP